LDTVPRHRRAEDRDMAAHRTDLPQLSNDLFLTDGGLETTLIFLEGHELPYFAAFDLMQSERGRNALRDYYRRYLTIAAAHDLGFIFESPTWRASADWAQKLGYSAAELADVNRRSIDLMAELRNAHEGTAPMVISGCVGPRGDGYDPGRVMSVAEAAAYHAGQIDIFRDTEADMVTAITMTNANEAIGITRAAMAAAMPVAISFTLETDGRLPTGQSLQDAITEVDGATNGAPAYYMINCAHPTHFSAALTEQDWMRRVRGIRANASKRSHAELDQATDLDAGDPVELGREYRQLRRRFGHINVLGGCCGTDHCHIEQICLACRSIGAGMQAGG
jgi:S-methylmethionine-dependent homocysteine/selenocysteine methylase